MENTILVLPLGGAFTRLFHAPPWGFWMSRPAPPWGICSFSKNKQNNNNNNNNKCPGGGGMGTLGIAWTIIDQTEGQDG